MTSERIVVEKPNVEDLLQTNQLLTNVNNLIEPTTISTGKAEFNWASKRFRPTGFRFIDLSIQSDVFSLLTCPNCSTGRKKDL